MAPEQLAGSEVTAQSDIYALGLVLYELFTGQRAIEAKNVAELVRKREAGIVPPVEIVRDLDPAIDRAILRCLERDPPTARRRRWGWPRRCRAAIRWRRRLPPGKRRRPRWSRRPARRAR